MVALPMRRPWTEQDVFRVRELVANNERLGSIANEVFRPLEEIDALLWVGLSRSAADAAWQMNRRLGRS